MITIVYFYTRSFTSSSRRGGPRPDVVAHVPDVGAGVPPEPRPEPAAVPAPPPRVHRGAKAREGTVARAAETDAFRSWPRTRFRSTTRYTCTRTCTELEPRVA